MKTSSKVLLVFFIALFIYNASGIAYPDLSWQTNQEIYIRLLLTFATIIAVIWENRVWVKKQKEN